MLLTWQKSTFWRIMEFNNRQAKDADKWNYTYGIYIMASEEKETSLVNRQGGFEGVFILVTPQSLFRLYELQLVFAVAQDCENLLKMGANSNRLFSHCFRKKKNQQPEFLLSC